MRSDDAAARHMLSLRIPKSADDKQALSVGVDEEDFQQQSSSRKAENPFRRPRYGLEDLRLIAQRCGHR